MLHDVLKAFGFAGDDYRIDKIGDGLINYTWKVTHPDSAQAYILQRINKQVFPSPQNIADNIDQVSNYLAEVNPGYTFISPLPTLSGASVLYNTDKEYYRLFPYVVNSVTINSVQTPDQAFEAASQFGRFTKQLQNFNSKQLHYTLENFHNLSLRIDQFKQAVKAGYKDRLFKAADLVEKAHQFSEISITYSAIVRDELIPLRVIHHDTKISNVLFDGENRGLCVIDLDTVMPGYYISDVGDMMRTYLSPANEEEADMSKIEIRENVFEAIVKGYFAEMGDILTDIEKSLFVYAGKFMIYMQAIRFLTDFLNNDVYYHTSYPGHNLARAENQFVLLEKYTAAESRFQEIVNNYS